MSLTRRRFLAITAASVGGLATEATALAHWSGRALGAPATMQLVGLPPSQAGPIFAAVTAEISRLEGIFSLYRADSDLVRLNATGRFLSPSADMLAVLSMAQAVHQATNGAFDPTVQPIWQAYADALTTGGVADLTGANARFGWSHVQFDTGVVALDKPGMALTLNGIAQGYITDRVNDILADFGLTDILIDVGEVAARGVGPDQVPWQAGVQDLHQDIVHRLQLSDRALATSAAKSLVLHKESGTGHILHPSMQAKHSLVAITAPKAALADALSTAGVLLTLDKLATAVAKFPDTEIAYINAEGFL